MYGVKCCKKCNINFINRKITSNKVDIGVNRLISWKFWKKSVKVEELPPPGTVQIKEDHLPEDEWANLTPEEEMRLRDHSGLSNYWKSKYYKTMYTPKKFDYLFMYKKEQIRKVYGLFGKESGIRPGVCWPRAEELEFMKKWEEKFYPTIHELFDGVKSEKEEERKIRQDRFKEVSQNMKKLPKLEKEFFEELKAKREQELEKKAKKEKLIQEVREYLGYNVDPKDLRFQEALEKIEAEEKLKKKAARKKDKQAALMAKISEMAAEDTLKVKEKEKEKVKSEKDISKK